MQEYKATIIRLKPRRQRQFKLICDDDKEAVADANMMLNACQTATPGGRWKVLLTKIVTVVDTEVGPTEDITYAAPL